MTGVAAATAGMKSTRDGAKIPRRARPSPASVRTTATATRSMPSVTTRSKEIDSEGDFLCTPERGRKVSGAVSRGVRESVLGVGTTTVRATFSVLEVGIVWAPTHADQL